MRDRMRVEWAASAARDAARLVADAAADEGTASARRLFDVLNRAAESLARKDAVSRILPELRETGLFDYRELPLEPWRLFFRMTRTRIRIVGVLDGRQDLRQILFRRMVEA